MTTSQGKEKNAECGNVVFEVVGRQKKVLSRAQRPAKHSTGSFYEKKERNMKKKNRTKNCTQMAGTKHHRQICKD